MASESGDDGARRAHFTYVWAIENSSPLSLTNKLLSPTFVVKAMEMTKWHLETEADHEAEQFMVCICREQDGCSNMFQIDFELSILGYKEYSLTRQSGTSEFQKRGIHRCEVIFDGEILNEHYPMDTMKIRCRMWRTGWDISQNDLCFARTHLRVEQRSFIWVIKRFSFLPPGQNKTIFVYPKFKCIPTLIFTFRLQEKDGKAYGCITVQRKELMEIQSMDVEVHLLDVEGCSVKSMEKGLVDWITREEEKVCEFSEFFERIEILSNDTFLVNNVLSLRCEFEISAGPLWSLIENYRQLESSDVEAFASKVSELHFESSANACCPFKDILKTLHEDGTLSDISLRAVGGAFSVHKNILSARSAVFKAMFTKDMKEMTAKYVDILDLNAETLRRLLLYIYTNRIEELQWKGAFDLFRAADKYLLLDLREICSNILKAKISASNACDILVLADLHHDEDLRKTVQEFISEDSDIFESDAWKNFKLEHSKLAFETIEQIICDMRKLL